MLKYYEDPAMRFARQVSASKISSQIPRFALEALVFGGMLLMMGGEEALLPLKEPFTEKMRHTLYEMVESDRFKAALQQGLDANKISEDIVSKIETVIDKRLSELTPQMVKEMVQLIISEHLGWLVVWGGIFGGLMGALFVFA